MGRCTTVQRATETYSRDQLFADLRNEARHLARQTQHTIDGRRAHTGAALDAAAERFYGAMKFVSKLVSGIPAEEQDVDRSDFRQIYWDAKEIAGQPVSKF